MGRLVSFLSAACSEQADTSLQELKLVGRGLQQTFCKAGNLLQLFLACGAVWLCSPSRLALSWSTALQVIVFGACPVTWGAVLHQKAAPGGEEGVIARDG